MDDETDPARVLDGAVVEALKLGLPCDGWCVQRSHDGYAAWLYVEDDDNEAHVSLLDPVEVHGTYLEAARWCLRAARTLLDDPPQLDLN